jgi:ring-1,2-phenylacetyl-CoA epoxidase subunit PaaD
MVTIATARAWTVLGRVVDPEIPVLSVVDLGIVRAVEESVDGRRVAVTVTPTYSGCPATEVIVDDIRSALAGSYDAVDVRVRLAPPWTTDWISEVGRQRLCEFGISPPNGRALLPIADDDRPGACPRCGSSDVEQLAQFGSTPCKGLWRCASCREPFDYFKVH